MPTPVNTSATPTLPKLAAEQIRTAGDRVAAALKLLGLDAPVTCPSCGSYNAKKTQLRVSSGNRPYFRCYKCGIRADGIELLTQFGGRNFPTAVTELSTIDDSALPQTLIGPSFVADCNPNIYNAIVTSEHVSADGAVAYWAEWDISEAAVRENKSVQVMNPDGLVKELLATWPVDDLIATGVMIIGANGKPRPLFAGGYRVLEPHISPLGHVFGFQLRPVGRAKTRVEAHKAAKANGDPAALAAAPYRPSVLGLRGAGHNHLVGSGLERVSQLPVGSTVRIVEGFKDTLAARTLGWEAYGIPGAGTTPNEKVLRMWKARNYHMVITLDADDAGRAGAERLEAHLRSEGIRVSIDSTTLPEGMDVANYLQQQ